MRIARTLLAAVLLGFTRWGRELRAIGGDRRASRVAGVRVDRQPVRPGRADAGQPRRLDAQVESRVDSFENVGRRYGEATAMASVLFAIVIVLAAGLMRLQRGGKAG